MTTITFDTLTYVKKLKAVGVPEAQAEVQAETIKELIAEQLAAKQDIKELEITLKREKAESKADTIKWVAAMLAAQAGLIAALVKII
jgi:hypothetical protein